MKHNNKALTSAFKKQTFAPHQKPTRTSVFICVHLWTSVVKKIIGDGALRTLQKLQ
ncbi:hypothetical protein ACE1B6_25475 [Aerosakkonemataceae cyanobacterium BLCC-F154]|uniref:Uncharacterized protein n=1 Tax=Floridaenema fluviatile BLCC-F154 TaxID=3153640 RepID=A0ABV4YIF9_9CYAN